MLRDNRKDEAYFQTLTSDLDDALTETQAALDDAVFTSPTQRVDVGSEIVSTSDYASGSTLFLWCLD